MQSQTVVFHYTNPNWAHDVQYNLLFLKGISEHLNVSLRNRGHLFLNEVYDALGLPRTKEGVTAGWVHTETHPSYVSFGDVKTDRDAIEFTIKVESPDIRQTLED